MDAAARAGLKNGRYEHEPWLNPTYMHSLIEAGRDIDALRLLGPPEENKPVFYDWLRGLALYRARDTRGAKEAFDRYFMTCPGDFGGLEASEEWLGRCGQSEKSTASSTSGRSRKIITPILSPSRHP
jgi:hypothetical protein